MRLVTQARRQKKLLKLVPSVLDEIDKGLEQTAQAVERGEVKIEDLDWESELDVDADKDA